MDAKPVIKALPGATTDVTQHSVDYCRARVCDMLRIRRLEERCPALRIEKTGRGRFRFHVLRPVTLAEIPR